MDRSFNLRMPLPLFQELARQAAERGLPVGAFIRVQLSNNLTRPANIHSARKDVHNAP